MSTHVDPIRELIRHAIALALPLVRPNSLHPECGIAADDKVVGGERAYPLAPNTCLQHAQHNGRVRANSGTTRARFSYETQGAF
jgi:hypothetical protein